MYVYVLKKKNTKKLSGEKHYVYFHGKFQYSNMFEAKISQPNQMKADYGKVAFGNAHGAVKRLNFLQHTVECFLF